MRDLFTAASKPSRVDFPSKRGFDHCGMIAVVAQSKISIIAIRSAFHCTIRIPSCTNSIVCSPTHRCAFRHCRFPYCPNRCGFHRIVTNSIVQIPFVRGCADDLPFAQLQVGIKPGCVLTGSVPSYRVGSPSTELGVHKPRLYQSDCMVE